LRGVRIVYVELYHGIAGPLTGVVHIPADGDRAAFI
jgi:hypothetical protein